MEDGEERERTTLASQLAHFEATGRLLPDAALIEGLVRVDTYLEAIAFARREHPGDLRPLAT